MPKISVLIISYNFERYIRECIDSILAQTLSPSEIIVCDDNSTDGSWEIISEYQNRHPRLIRSYKHEKNLGMTKNYNFALRSALGDLVSMIDGDDRWLPNKLEIEWAALEKSPKARFAYSNVFKIDDQGRRTGIWYDGTGEPPPSGDVFSYAFSGNFFRIPLSLYRQELIYRSDVEALGYLDEEYKIFEDLDFGIRVTHRLQGVYSGEALVEYRLHDGGIHNSPFEIVFRDLLLVFFKNYPLLLTRGDSEVRQVRGNVVDLMFSLVSQIHQASEDRLQLVDALDAECKMLRQVCDERLGLINRLDAQCKELQKPNLIK